MARFRRIVHPTDFSPASGPALRTAVELALETQRRQAAKELSRVVKRAQNAGVRTTGTIVDVGPVADGIVRFAKREGADVIVIGTHGHGALAKVLLGSVAERVISQAAIPVMTVRRR